MSCLKNVGMVLRFRELKLLELVFLKRKMSRIVTQPTKWGVRPAKTQISLGIRPVIGVFAVRLMGS